MFGAMWRAVVAGVILVGVVAVAVQLTVVALVFIMVLTGAGGAVAATMRVLEQDMPTRAQVQTALRTGTLSALAGAGAFGILLVLEGPGLALLVVLALTSPALVDRVRRHLGSRSSDEHTDQLSDAELCEHWSSSWQRLGEARNPRLRLAVVREREALLDEMAVRHPDRFERWILSPQAAAHARRFLTDNSGGDW